MEVTGVLLAKDQHIVLWCDKGIASMGRGGILAAALGSALTPNEAINSLFFTLPGSVGSSK